MTGKLLDLLRDAGDEDAYRQVRKWMKAMCREHQDMI